MLKEYNFYSKIDNIKYQCFRTLEDRVYSMLGNRDYIFNINLNKIVIENFNEIEKLYNSEEYINILK